jgi:uncharacterized lipoprotein YmbA
MDSLRSKRTTTWLLSFLILVLALSLAACGGSAPAPTPTPLPTATPTPTPAPTPTPEVAVAAPAAAAATAGDGVVVTEQQINDMLQEALASQQDLPVTDVVVNLEPGQIVGTGKLALGFLNSDVRLVVRLSAVNGTIVPEVVAIELDGNPVPAMLKGQVDSMIQPFIEQTTSADYGFYVESVEITDTELRVVAR